MRDHGQAVFAVVSRQEQSTYVPVIRGMEYWNREIACCVRLALL